ncbi:hypothetical protein CCZ01_02980 [Helicobacter monodelphidis]|uniref:PEP-utilizing enzyme n=1 Tax=Helicobacter sp. 15-1451 TaxID=2004995 RepID=UPI000DCB721E|nr:PEP-utilizing enzyme [Helicobacter sp. 15-1451]RAX58395.1 hypothetical protein CCZ01_02980 [Helicobacter sp. 15-1451]
MLDSLTFKSKAQNLKALYHRLSSAKILPLVITSLEEFNHNPKEVYLQIQYLQANFLIIRSSSKSEDSQNHSNAGAFLSLANIPNDFVQVKSAILEVGKSMPLADDEILIQPMLSSISLCGVCFSVDKENAAPYYTISYDTSGSHYSITSGINAEIQSLCHYRYAQPPKNEIFAKIIMMMQELEESFQHSYLDVEFALADGVLYCLQVRPLVMENKPNFYHYVTENALSRLCRRINTLNQKLPHILGKRAIFGVMPDWNPAEMIGFKPKTLALSLYKEIITDHIWAYQRDNYGYRNLRSYPLMHSFLGVPYIDVRLSFNSFIPKKLDEEIAQKLVNFYLDSLARMPQFHDKVEFEIVHSCYDLNTPQKLEELLDCGFNQNEIKRIEFALLELTNEILNPKNGLYLKDLQRASLLEERFHSIVSSSLSLYDKIYWLIEDCKRFGTLPFAGIARAAFIAMQLLNSLVETKLLSSSRRQNFLASLRTISKELTDDIQNLPHNKEVFLAKYGHLRAGSYNILSPRYDEAFESYFKHSLTQHTTSSSIPIVFNLTQTEEQAINQALKENGLEIDARALFAFFKIVIEGRESVKFAFSKLLSQTLSYIKDLGDYLDISVEDMAHVDIKSILGLYSSLYKDSPREKLLNEIKINKENFNLTLALKLPPLIIDGEDIFSFHSSKISPNFITQKSITAETAQESSEHLMHKIVLIPSADPGYDYLFTKNIAGLITCYGGANSHMAIRASELQLPAVIGVGEENFNLYLRCRKIRIDCESEQIFCLEG